MCYNIRMNKNESNVIQFPKKDSPDKWSQERYDLETTHHLINIVVEELEDLGYDTDDSVLQKDIGVLANLMYASFQRNHKNAEHIFHFVLDESEILAPFHVFDIVCRTGS